MEHNSDNPLNRIVQWIVVAFGLIVAIAGGFIWYSGGGEDVGGVLGGFFLFGGLSIAILAMPKPRWWKD